jgi:ATP-binding cassette subfamily B protein
VHENYLTSRGERSGFPGEVLLLQAPQVEQKEQFSFWWFVPALMEHKTVFFEVLLASFFVQLFGLATH